MGEEKRTVSSGRFSVSPRVFSRLVAAVDRQRIRLDLDIVSLDRESAA